MNSEQMTSDMEMENCSTVSTRRTDDPLRLLRQALDLRELPGGVSAALRGALPGALAARCPAELQPVRRGPCLPLVQDALRRRDR